MFPLFRDGFRYSSGAVFKRIFLVALPPNRQVIVRRYGGNEDYLKSIIGNREIVGFGFNGMPFYADRTDFPFPAIRYKEPTPELDALKGKERGDWRQLSLEEKKTLYRASFCQTFAELLAPTGEWMGVVGWTLILFSFSIFFYYIFTKIAYRNMEIPKTMTGDYVNEQMKRLINIAMNPVSGFASNWDYEKMEWKNKDSWGAFDNPFEDPCNK